MSAVTLGDLVGTQWADGVHTMVLLQFYTKVLKIFVINLSITCLLPAAATLLVTLTVSYALQHCILTLAFLCFTTSHTNPCICFVIAY